MNILARELGRKECTFESLFRTSILARGAHKYTETLQTLLVRGNKWNSREIQVSCPAILKFRNRTRFTQHAEALFLLTYPLLYKKKITIK